MGLYKAQGFTKEGSGLYLRWCPLFYPLAAIPVLNYPLWNPLPIYNQDPHAADLETCLLIEDWRRMNWSRLPSRPLNNVCGHSSRQLVDCPVWKSTENTDRSLPSLPHTAANGLSSLSRCLCAFLKSTDPVNSPSQLKFNLLSQSPILITPWPPESFLFS